MTDDITAAEYIEQLKNRRPLDFKIRQNVIRTLLLSYDVSGGFSDAWRCEIYRTEGGYEIMVDGELGAGLAASTLRKLLELDIAALQEAAVG